MFIKTLINLNLKVQLEIQETLDIFVCVPYELQVFN
jgi:hypothetical protein